MQISNMQILPNYILNFLVISFEFLMINYT